MGKGRPRAVEIGQNPGSASSSRGSLHVPPAPVYRPSEEEFKDPLAFIEKIRPEAELYGICKIVPPKSWSPPFALNLERFNFPTKTQAIHQLQVRPASCDSKTFELEYGRFLVGHCGKKGKRKRVVFEGGELDLCKLFNAVKRFGGYDKVVKEKKWGEVSRFVRPGRKVSECAKHVLGQLYREHLYDYEEYYHRLSKGVTKCGKRTAQEAKKSGIGIEVSCSKRRRRDLSSDDDEVRLCDLIKKAKERDQICEQCRSGLHGEVMLLCDRCDKGWHIYCLSPPLKQVPLGNWYCFECLNSNKDTFGFVPGKCLTLEAFQRVAERVKRRWFSSRSASRVQIEKKFWEIVEGSSGEVEVVYGSDLDTSIYGSGFPRVDDQRVETVEAEVWEEYSRSPWNLNNLPKLRGSMLRAVHQNITGVMVPWLYVGMLFSSFCWHFEDHCFYSMNYLHWGEPKCWYSVPGMEASAFEKVMRDSLPDLFDAQPDLLFQLVTMLNPSVLQEHGVPVYTVLQEPGNFIITFPRSYHAGFNLGLNCAEAVNFAPADWLLHGGFAAELYQMYRKTAVLSHEELLCVVAKLGDWDSKVLSYLKNELLRIYDKEKTWREKLWSSGLVKSSPMPPKKCPESVGTEEDPVCIICKQFLYLSAVVCRCRQSSYVCLEHWRQMCECRSSKLRLLYRYTLSELHDMVLMVDKNSCKEVPQSNLQRKISCSDEQHALTKKVKGGRVSLAQLAKEWLLRSDNFSKNPCSADVCAKLLKETEQFLWAGAEMNPVRDGVKNMIFAQKWAQGIRDCLSKIQNWSSCDSCGRERVKMEFLEELLNLDPGLCNEPGHLKLKVYAEEAHLLIQEIGSALSSSSNISELEALYAKVSDFPILLKESNTLLQRISSAKVFTEGIRKCLSEKGSAAIELDTLYKLKSQVMELQVQLPETQMLFNLATQAERCQLQCIEILNGPCSLENVERLLQEWEKFTVDIPELALLKQCHVDAVFWKSRYQEALASAPDRDDQDQVVNELNQLLKDGTSLRIQVGQLSVVEVELKKACCRQKAQMAHHTKMSMDSIQQLVAEAVLLQIETEELFVDISGELAAAVCWEERATEVLAHKTIMSAFEDLIRTSADISIMLPSLGDIKKAVAMANNWLKNSEPFVVASSSSSLVIGYNCLLKLETLKDLVLQSKSLQISLKEERMLEMLLKNCENWEQVAHSALHDTESILNASDIGDGTGCILVRNLQLITRIEGILKDSISLGIDFLETPKLQNACSVLQWCVKAFSFCRIVPAFEDIEKLMDAAENLAVTCASGTMWSSLIDGVKWLRKASKIVSFPANLSDAEEILADLQDRSLSFPLMVDQLVNSIEKHKLWSRQVHKYFSQSSEQQTWSLLLELKELGKDAFSCSELDRVISEAEKIEKWKRQCLETIRLFTDDSNELLATFRKIRQSLDLSLYIYGKPQSYESSSLCICCCNLREDQDSITCSTCEQCYHMKCLEAELASDDSGGLTTCSYCRFLKNGLVSRKDSSLLVQKFGGQQPELRVLVDLLSDAGNFSIRIEEKEMLREVVEKALKCQTCLREILDYALSHVDKDLTILVKKLAIALKAMDAAGVYDHNGNSDLELATARNSWKVRVGKLLGAQKPSMHQIQRHIKEGLTIGIHPEDYFSCELKQLNEVGLAWAGKVKKVTSDSGVLDLETIFELISEGENLPVFFEKELKLLRARSALYCICRRPYDARAKVICDQCQEWYHIDCVNLVRQPKFYVCAACKPQSEELSAPFLGERDRSTSYKLVEPKTPSPKRPKSGLKPKELNSTIVQDMFLSKDYGVFNRSSGIDQLWWRNRKPFRRVAKKRAVLDSLHILFPRQ